MTPREIQIVEQIKTHSDIISQLTKELNAEQIKKKSDVNAEEMERFQQRFRKSLYKKKPV